MLLRRGFHTLLEILIGMGFASPGKRKSESHSFRAASSPAGAEHAVGGKESGAQSIELASFLSGGASRSGKRTIRAEEVVLKAEVEVKSCSCLCGADSLWGSKALTCKSVKTLNPPDVPRHNWSPGKPWQFPRSPSCPTQAALVARLRDFSCQWPTAINSCSVSQ